MTNFKQEIEIEREKIKKDNQRAIVVYVIIAVIAVLSWVFDFHDWLLDHFKETVLMLLIVILVGIVLIGNKLDKIFK